MKIKFFITSVNLESAKSVAIVISGENILSTLEWLISLSCHRATFSIAGMVPLRINLAIPVKFSLRIGLRL